MPTPHCTSLGSNASTLTDIINCMTQLVTYNIFWFATLAWFFWNLSQIIWNSGNAEKRKQSGMRLVWSVIALTVVFLLPGIINVIIATLFPHL